MKSFQGRGPGQRAMATVLCATLALPALAQPGAKVIQMGAGFIGCIIMEALAARGVQLTVVEMGDRMVPRMMGPTAGGMIMAWCEAKGVRVFTGTRVEAIESGHALRVRLSNGQSLEADLVISATGVKPAIGFLKDSGITCLLGVLTDEHMQTSVPGIYAAGDCAEAFDKLSGRHVVSAIQPNAADQARVAALNMAGMLSFIDAPNKAKLAEYTKQVYANTPYRDTMLEKSEFTGKSVVVAAAFSGQYGDFDVKI